MSKIAPDHLRRQAFVYVRQSTRDQLRHHHESRRRQYGLADRARRGQFSSGVVEGFNGKARVITKRAYGFRTSGALEVALYHALGNLPEPELTHRFC